MTVTWQSILYLIVNVVYNVFLHPLSSFPGPKLAFVSRLPYIRAQLRERLSSRMKALHDNYRSDFVCMAPDAKEPSETKQLVEAKPGLIYFGEHGMGSCKPIRAVRHICSTIAITIVN